LSAPKILIIGESCLDEFAYCQATRLAPDWPVPILEVDSVISNPGMASNVLMNIRAMGAETELVTNNNWKEFKKRRYVHSKTNHTFMRVDTTVKIESLNDGLDITSFDAVVISDYNKGFLSTEKIWELCNQHSRVFLDTKKPLGEWATKAFIVKINDFEYSNSLPFVSGPIRKKVIRTLGERGCEYQGKLFPTETVSVSDTSGAGDTFIAALVCSFLANNNIELAIREANKAATSVVKKRGVVSV